MVVAAKLGEMAGRRNKKRMSGCAVVFAAKRGEEKNRGGFSGCTAGDCAKGAGYHRTGNSFKKREASFTCGTLPAGVF